MQFEPIVVNCVVIMYIWLLTESTAVLVFLLCKCMLSLCDSGVSVKGRWVVFKWGSQAYFIDEPNAN